MIEIRKSEGGKNTVSLRELYEFLNLDKSHWSRWVRMNITGNSFATENVDYKGFAIMAKGNKTTDYEITLELAKKIAMMANTKEGNQVREYFIDCEKKAKESQTFDPAKLSRIDILHMALDSESKRLELEAENKELRPKAEFYDAVTNSNSDLDMGQVAKVLNYKGFGRTNLFRFLREQKVLKSNNEPYQRFVDSGYFRLIEQRFVRDDHTHINVKTIVLQKGVDFIRRKVDSYLEAKKATA